MKFQPAGNKPFDNTYIMELLKRVLQCSTYIQKNHHETYNSTFCIYKYTSERIASHNPFIAGLNNVEYLYNYPSDTICTIDNIYQAVFLDFIKSYCCTKYSPSFYKECVEKIVVYDFYQINRVTDYTTFKSSLDKIVLDIDTTIANDWVEKQEQKK